MKRALFAMVLAGGTLWAGSPFAGHWQGKLDGLPAASLTVKEDHGQLAGSIIFYWIRKDAKGTRIDGDAKCELLQVATQGKRMTFEVQHHVRDGGLEYGPNAKFIFELKGANMAMLRNVSEGMSMRMARE
jgi:hypothetical protein